jgi:hypothetical protein
VVFTPENGNLGGRRPSRGHIRFRPCLSWYADHSQLSVSQLETQCQPYLVRFSQKQPHDLLTKAMHHPGMMDHTHGFLFDNPHLVRNDPAPGPSTTQKALLVGWERDTTGVALMIGLVALLSVLAGVVVGVLLHNASLGIAASSGLATILSCVDVLVIWQFQ